MDRSLAPIAVQAVDGPHISSLTLSLAEGDQRLVSKLLRAKGARQSGRAKALRSVYCDMRREALGRVGYRLSVRAQGNKRVQPIEPDRPLSALVHARLARRLQTLLKAARKLDGCAPDTEHHIRVAVKELRHAIKAFHSVIGAKTSRKLVSRLVQLQDVLGELNDARSSHAMALTHAQEGAGFDCREATLFAAGLAAAACNPGPAAALAQAAATRDEMAALA